MPKRIRQQRRGKGKQVFRAPSFRFKFTSKYRGLDTLEQTGKLDGKVIDIVNDTARTAPLMIIHFENGENLSLPSPNKMRVGTKVAVGLDAPVAIGNVLPLGKIPAGTIIYNIELRPGDCGKLVKAGATSAKVVSHEGNKVVVRLPSKLFKSFNPKCRATIGEVSGFGRKEKPIIKAGVNYHVTRARGKYWPMVAGVAMNAINHPYGGKRRSTQKSKKKPSPRNAPPGRKVGSIAPKRTGRRKGKVRR
ncbi:MAG TPA: 50S ribosomal protein L2 [Candidatus Woesearchaeota archaeon]|nr:50S ribosomal protein L2 [Candidatus Woesearchaeota archaeon]